MQGASMAVIIADLETTVASADGHDYYVQVVGEQVADGTWEAWLEFVPLDDELEVLLTKTETTQSSREAVIKWAETLRDTFLEGAFERAVGDAATLVVRDYVTDEQD